jgi:hypothetical protein
MKKLAIVLLVGVCATVEAQVISWNYDRNGTVSGANEAGIVRVANWNNSWPSDPTTDLIDNSGAATTLDLTYGPTAYAYSIQGSHPGQDADGSYNKELLNGYLNAGMASWNPPITNSYVTLSEIPYAQYNLYVYFSSDVADRPGYATDGASTFYFSTIGLPSISGANALFTLTTETSSANHPQANYALFAGLSGASQNITLQMEQPELWGGIAGFQVEAVPEPSSVALLLAGVAGLLVRARQK